MSGDPGLAAERGASIGKSATADENGRYRLSGVSPGTYILVAKADGYIRQPYGGKPGYFGTYNGRAVPFASTQVAVAGSGEIPGLDVRLTRLSQIAGRVTTAKGDPAGGVPVYAVRWTYMDGTRKLLEQGRAATNAAGDYRISGLAPGSYYLYASPPLQDSRPEAVPRIRQRTYAPNALRLSETAALELTAGMDGSADVRLREDALVSVRGNVVGAGSKELEGATVLLMNSPDTPTVGGLWGAPTGEPPLAIEYFAARTVTRAKGEFVLNGVVPGVHRLLVFGGNGSMLNTSSEGLRGIMGGSRAAGPEDDSVGRLDLMVKDEGAEGVTILLRPGGEIALKVAMDTGSYREWARQRLEQSSIPETQRARMINDVPQVALLPADGISVGGYFATRPGGLGGSVPDGLRQRVSTGQYFVDVSGRNQLYYVKSIRLGSEDLTHKMLEHRGGSGDLEIILGTDAGKVTGVATDSSGNPVPGAQLTLWPREVDFSQRNGGAQVTSSRHDGSFSFPLVAPGEYDVVAFEALPDPGLAEYPPFVSRMAGSGKPVKVDPNKTSTLHVPTVTEAEAQRVASGLN